jgi:hypothetical protein
LAAAQEKQEHYLLHLRAAVIHYLTHIIFICSVLNIQMIERRRLIADMSMALTAFTGGLSANLRRSGHKQHDFHQQELVQGVAAKHIGLYS